MMVDYSNLIEDTFAGEQQAAKSQVVGSIDDEPDKAARAMELGQAWGISPVIVHGDMDNFERTQKQQLASQIVGNNVHLQNYVNSDPLAAKISNDDYGQLDAASQAYNRAIGNKSLFMQYAGKPISILGSAFEGFREGFGSEPVGSWIGKTDYGKDYIKRYPYSAYLLALEGGAFELPARVFTGALHGIKGGTSELLKQAGVSEQSAEQFSRDVTGMAEQQLMGLTGVKVPVAQTFEALRPIEPYARAGKEPPPGVSEVVDAVKSEQAKLDADNLGQAIKEAAGSATLERSPQMMEQFYAQHPEAQVGISADAIRELYGEKQPMPGDGILGDMPGLRQQFETAEAIGGDVDVPLKSFIPLAAQEPELYKALEDHIRFREGGLTVEEAKQGIEVYHGSPHEFEAFDIGKAGTGEGAQSYGFGHYFAENPEVAQDYAKKLGISPMKTAYQYLITTKGDRAKAVEAIEETTLHEGKSDWGEPLEVLNAAIELLKSDKEIKLPEEAGNLYRTRILRRPEEFLDYDAPLSEQPQALRDLVKERGIDTDLGWNSIVGEDASGGMAYDNLVSSYMREKNLDVTEARKAVSDELAKRGIAGIKYLDQFSRDKASVIKQAQEDIAKAQERIAAYESGAEVSRVGLSKEEHIQYQQGIIADAEKAIAATEKSTSNFVVFRDADIEVLERNGEAVRTLREATRLEPIGVPEEPEKIEFAAIKVGDRIYKGTNHNDALDRASAELNVTPEQFVAQMEGKENVGLDGFLTNTGRFLTRKEAYALEEAKPTVKAQQLELPQDATTRMEDRAAFDKAAAIGMTKDQYARYQRLIAERREADAKAMDARAMAEQRKVQSAEWKANRAEMRPQVADEIRQRPEFELDEELRGGKLKFATEALTDEQLAALPKEYVAKDGVHPDDLAGLYGYDSGVGLVDDLVALTQARAASGMKPKAFIERAIDAETDRRMEQKYGKLDENILEEAKDQVLSAIQEEMLHEEMLALAEKAGAQFSLTKPEVAAWVKEKFDNTQVSSISSDKFLQAAGKAGRETELALLKKDPAEAFRQKQRQFLAFSMATAARKLEKSLERFDKTAKRFSAREVSGVDQEYTNWIHNVLSRIGKPVKRSVQDLEGELAYGGRTGTTTLADFVDYQTHHGLREVPVADFLMNPEYRKPVEQMTAAEFEAVHNSIKALVKNGRDEKKLIKAGDEADFDALKAKMIEQMKRFKPYLFDTKGDVKQPLAGPRHALRTVVAAHLQIEAILNKLDRFDYHGIFNQYLFRPLVESANRESRLLREYATKLGSIADDANLKELIPDSPLKNPRDGSPLQMTRKNLRVVLANMGNESNFHKLAGGYLEKLDPSMPPGENRLAIFKQEIRDWINTHAKKEDWDWAQKIWDMLEELHQKSNTMYRNLTDVPPESLVITPIETPFGTYRGGYYPLIRHPRFAEDVKLKKNGLEEPGYIRAVTPAGYTKARTGALYPLSLELDSLPNQIRQIIHDVTFRPAVIQAGKILYDKKIMAELENALGPEKASLFIPWLRDVANVQNFMSAGAKEFQYWIDFARQNATTTLVGLNVGTFMKHTPTAIISSMAEVGPANFLKAMRSLVSINEETGEKNWQYAMNKSEELQRRSRNWLETMGGGLATLEGRTVGKALKQGDYGAAFMSMREVVAELSSKPVALGDLLSAVPTWLARYEMEMREHGIEGDAVYAADKAVRQAHGSSAITSRSRVARSRGLGSLFTTFFTFFNDILNRQIETLWRAGEAAKLAKSDQKAEAMAQVPKLAGRLFAYVIAPAIIEEMVTPLTTQSGDSWAKIAGKSLLFTLGSSWVGAREVVSAWLNQRDPSIGIMTTIGKSGTDMLRDLSAKHPKQGNIIKHGTQLSGMLTGLTPAPIGRAAEFALSNEHPRGPWGWLVGLRYGTLKHHAPTFEQYMRGH